MGPVFHPGRFCPTLLLSHQSHLALTQTGWETALPRPPPRLDQPEIRTVGLASVTQCCTVPPFFTPGAQHSEESPPHLTAEGLGLNVLVSSEVFPRWFMLG